MKQKKMRYRFTVVGILMLLLVILTIILGYCSLQIRVKAATEEEKVVIRDSQKTYRENISVELGKTNTNCYAVVTPDSIVDKSVTYSSQNTEIMTVQTVLVNGTYYAYMTGIKEGVTRVVATTASGKTYSSYVTVYTAISDTPGIINTNTVLKKTALADAENFTKTANVNDVGIVKGRVGSYLYMDMPAGYLEKSYHIAYVEKEKVTIKCSQLQLDVNSLIIYVNEKKKLQRKVLPILTSNRAVTFTSSNKSVAVVSNKGTVRGRKQGVATITCTAADGSGKSASCKVTVKQKVKKIVVKNTSFKLQKGKTKKLTAKITPKTADNKNVSWSSSKETVATVDSQGKVTAVGKGTAVITCTAQDGSGVCGKSKIIVEPKYKIEIQNIGTLTVGDTVKAQADLLEQDGEITKKATSLSPSKKLIWISSNRGVATVDKYTGVIRAIHPGRFVLTCRTTDGKTVGKTTVWVGDTSTVTKEIFKKIPKEKYVEYKKDGSVFLSANATGLEWTSLTPGIAQVSNGVVTMKSSGVAYIQCKKNNKVKKQCKIYIYKKAKQKYGILKENRKKGIGRQEVSVLGMAGDNNVVIVTGGKKSGVVIDEVLLYSTKANRHFFYENANTLLKGVHFVNKDTAEFNENEAIVYNIVDDTLYIHINVKFRGDGAAKEFITKGFYGKIESQILYKNLAIQGIEQSFTLDKVDFSMTPFPNDLKLKVVTKIHDLDDNESITKVNSNIKREENKKSDNYVVIQIGNHTNEKGKVISPLLEEGDYWYFARQYYNIVPIKKNSTSIYEYRHYARTSYGHDTNRKIIYLPTQEMLAQNVGEHYEVPSPAIYRRSVAHEMGHVLGLDDAYEYRGEKINISRVSKKLDKQDLVMKNGKEYDKVNSLEIVMLLYARNQSITKSEISWQSFHNYAIYTNKDSDGIKHYEAGLESQAIK